MIYLKYFQFTVNVLSSYSALACRVCLSNSTCKKKLQHFQRQRRLLVIKVMVHVALLKICAFSMDKAVNIS